MKLVTLHADARKRFTHFVQLEGFDDGGHQFHKGSLLDLFNGKSGVTVGLKYAF